MLGITSSHLARSYIGVLLGSRSHLQRRACATTSRITDFKPAHGFPKVFFRKPITMDQSHPRGNSSFRGRFRGDRRGGGNDRIHRSEYPSNVPSSRQVVPGAGVSIILKADQPTGRQVTGVVQDVLGRGEHPRGIKVRLEDGRVGRTQAIVNVETARAASAGLSNLGRDGEPAGPTSSAPEPRASLPVRQSQFSDMRYDGYDYDSSVATRNEPSLLDYVRVKGKKGKGNSRATPRGNAGPETEASPTNDQQVSPELTTCPVCKTFEGDAAAVEHHVNSHFE